MNIMKKTNITSSSNINVIVIGAGHAGVEASLACSRMGLKVLLFTTKLSRVAYMSCNPSIGGLAKGNLVKEIDTLGGVMGLAADASCLQYKQLNSKKGPAVRGSRVQCDKKQYSHYIQQYIKKDSNIQLVEEEITGLLIKKNKCYGVITKEETHITAQVVILTTGTFMGAVMHMGQEQKEGGRLGDQSTKGLSQQLASIGFKVTRLKTGTPPRLHQDSIDWSQTVAQKGDTYRPFSFFSPKNPPLPSILCYLTHTNPRTHQVIYDNLSKSPLYSGVIQGIGPRYCPSIEDKVVRFKDKLAHQIFLAPEDMQSPSIYVQGISTSLPKNVQEKFLRTIKGLEKSQILQAGYAVEYDFINPIQLKPTLETKMISSLYLAGQVNGSSGYEEAACQGMMAGINAAASILKLPALILQRFEGYTGVLIDDLVTKGTTEPYRILTSRAEYRLLLREDNVAERLFPIAKKYSLLPQNKMNDLESLLEKRNKYKKLLLKTKWKYTDIASNKQASFLSVKEGETIEAKNLLKRPEISFKDLEKLGFPLTSPEIAEPVEIEIKYEGYIQRQNKIIKKNQKMASLNLKNIDYKKIKSLSLEAREKLQEIQPRTLGQAERIMGVSPTAIQSLIVYLHAQKVKELSLNSIEKKSKNK